MRCFKIGTSETPSVLEKKHDLVSYLAISQNLVSMRVYSYVITHIFCMLIKGEKRGFY
ncbi:hypothetical protein VSA01S_38270 [Vibrio sagamiensis NBRC 104589]|uniref:Uncharacterized protein n=1 Tax=Vibrio sagamiensis NBRC 104589 TaxID=1219064 RepID=A0A511QK53_9VIBR|nr:hypothetical protein VSA01S_38270 [Vibrio sagamiensis NBRC 104589]